MRLFVFLHFLFFQELSGSLQPIWSTKLPNSIDSSQPWIENDVVYVGCVDQRIYAVNFTTGKIIWSQYLYSAVTNSPLVVNNRLFIAAGNKMFCFFTDNARQAWQYTTDGTMFNIIVEYLNGMIYFGSSDGIFRCLDAATGEEIWSYDTGSGTAITSPTIDQNNIYFGTSDGRIIQLNLTGYLVWNQTLSGSIQGRPTVTGNLLYVGTLAGDVYIFVLPSHYLQTLNNFPYGGISRQILIADSIAYIVVGGGEIFACPVGQLGAIWYAGPTGTFTDIVYHNRALYSGNADHNLYELSSEHGYFLSSVSSNDEITSTPRLIGNDLLSGSKDHNLTRYTIIPDIPTLFPTPYPTAYPTPEPSVSTFVRYFNCPEFELTKTNNASIVYRQCVIPLCYNQVAEINLCTGNNDQVDTFIRLFDSNQTQIAENDNWLDKKCSALTYRNTRSKVKCELFNLHQGCANNEECFGSASVYIHQPVDYLLKYSLVFLFNNTQLLPNQQAINLNYLIDANAQTSIPFPYADDSTNYFHEYDRRPEVNETLVKWRTVKHYLQSNQIVYGPWSGSKLLGPSQRVLFWVVSEINEGVLGFILRDVSNGMYEYYQFKEQLLSRHLSEELILNTYVTIQPIQTFNTLNKFTFGVSNKNVYLLDVNLQ